ncbi:MAG TPA: efflux RND transporter permease subunit [Gemmataceae bacterium]|nr:efflux RND transporter permease subunit [Gemmataceae bacterium]
MNPIVFALRHPLTVMVAIVAVVLTSALAFVRMPIDIFPDLNTPTIYVAQPYGGIAPQQMEGFLTYYYEYHFLYITGIEHVESKNIQGVALMKLLFHPGTNMAQAMAETVNYVNRAHSFQPQGTVPPFIMRFDAGSVPVGYLVFSSQTRSIGEIQDQALNHVRPMFASLPGVSAPPPFGGNQRTIVIHANPESLRAHNMSPDEVVAALLSGNQITPSGSVVIGDKAPMVEVNSVVSDPQDLNKIVIRPGVDPPVYIRDIGWVEDSTDVASGYGLVDGKRSVYILVTKRADASTLSVVNEVKANLPRMREQVPQDIAVTFEFDQSPYVTRAMWGVGLEALLGAMLTGIMVILFLRDWRSVIVVVLNIPFALLGGVVALWLTGQTMNLMTLGGLALAVGILVDEATVEVENIHSQMDRTRSIARAVRLGNAETAVPRLLAMLCILAVFTPAFFMRGAAQALFVPLSLAVGFSMVTSYLLSSTFVPVLSTWLLRHYQAPAHAANGWFSFNRFTDTYAWLLQGVLRVRWVLLGAYLALAVLLVAWWLVGHTGVGTGVFPTVDSGQFQLRLRAPDGTPLEQTEALTKEVLDAIGQEVGRENVEKTVTLVGTASYNYPINSIFLWSSGPQEAVLRIALKRGSGVRVEELKERLRRQLPQLTRQGPPAMKDVKFSFEAGDIVGQVMSFGSPTPVEVTIRGKNIADDRAYAAKVKDQLDRLSSLRDLQYGQPLDYPALEVNIDREKAGLSGATVAEVGKALSPATLSSRFVAPNFWRDPKTNIGFQVQLELPASRMNSAAALGLVPIKRTPKGQLLVRDVAQIRETTVPGEDDRYNGMPLFSLTANIAGEDLGRVGDQIERALKDVNRSLWTSQPGPTGAPGWKNTISGDVVQQREQPSAPPRGLVVEVRGQIVPMQQMFQGLAIGLGMAVVVIFLLLAGYFQSLRLAIAVTSTAPAVIAGVAVALVVTRTTLNIQSFMGAVMAIGVAVANAILLVTFAEKARREGADPLAAALDGAKHRLRPILMTSCAMIAGMLPMALGLGEGGEQTAPLGRAVIGGLVVATLGTLVILPSVFAVLQGRSSTRSASLDPDDPASPHYDQTGVQSGNGRPPSDGAAAIPSPVIEAHRS